MSSVSAAPITPVATLSMYDWPEIQSEMDQFWTLIADQLADAGISAPPTLDRSTEPTELWLNPDLLIGQTCGWPYANLLKGKVVPFGRFHYAVDVLPPGHYASVFIGNDPVASEFLENANALREVKCIAVNSEDSQSGFQVFGEITGSPANASVPIAKCLMTGAHRESIKAVASGEAQLAAIDAVAFELAKIHEKEAAENVFVVGRSQPKPGLPLITSFENQTLVTQLFEAVSNAIRQSNSALLDRLLIKGVVPASEADYEGFTG